MGRRRLPAGMGRLLATTLVAGDRLTDCREFRGGRPEVVDGRSRQPVGVAQQFDRLVAQRDEAEAEPLGGRPETEAGVGPAGVDPAGRSLDGVDRRLEAPDRPDEFVPGDAAFVGQRRHRIRKARPESGGRPTIDEPEVAVDEVGESRDLVGVARGDDQPPLAVPPGDRGGIRVLAVRAGNDREIRQSVPESRQPRPAAVGEVSRGIEAVEQSVDGRVVFANRTLAEMFGYTVEELLAMSPQETQANLPPKGQAFLDRQNQARREGSPVSDHYDMQVYTKSGDLRWTEQFVTSIGYQGRPALQIAVIDRTERRQAEAQREAALAALRESEERFRLTIELATIGVALVDSEGNMTVCNAALAEMVGYSREELLALNFADFTHPEDLARERVLIQDLWDETATQYRMEKRYVHKDGHVVWADLAASMFKDERRESSFGFAFVRDITERKRIESQREAAVTALRESEERVRKAFDTELVGMAISRRRDGFYLDANPGFLKMTGYTADEVIGHTSLELSFFFPSQRERLVSKIEKDGRLHNQELTYPTKSGEVRTVLFSIGPITLENEPCLLTTMVDITARKRAAERTQALLRATDRLSRALTQDDLLNTLCQEVGRALDLSAISVLRYRPEKERFTLERTLGLPEVYERTYRAPGQEAYARFAHESIVVVPDIQAADVRANHDLYVACDVRTLVEVSIVYKDELLGVLNVHTLGKARDFASGELTLLRGIAGQAAQAIITARLLAQLRTSERQLQRLSERLVEAQEVERRALARELHDELGQTDPDGDQAQPPGPGPQGAGGRCPGSRRRRLARR